MEVYHVVGFSGGIDSQAVARWVLNRFPKEFVILLNSDVGGHEYEKQTGLPFFAPRVPGVEKNFVDDVVEWSKTVYGGRQYSLDVLYEPAVCESSYGLCE